MKKLLALVLALALTVCAGSALAETVIDPSADRGITPKGANAEGKWDNNPVIDGVNPVTGLAWTGKYIPIMVNVDNIISALPQWGVGDADLIYELPIDGIGMTRIMALFTTLYPEHVGPVRSARVLHADMRQEWCAAWVFAGGQEAQGSNVFTRIRSYGLYDTEVNLVFNLLGAAGAPYSTNVKHHASPHNHQASVAALRDALEATGYEFTQRPFLFADALPENGDEAQKVVYDFGNGNSDSYYVYNSASNDYARYLSKTDKPYVDMDDSETTLCFNNVIVEWTKLSYFEGASNRPDLTEIGQGNADFFMGGKHIAGYWVRTDADSRTVYFDADGNELKLQPGKTWITVASPKFLSVSFE